MNMNDHMFTSQKQRIRLERRLPPLARLYCTEAPTRRCGVSNNRFSADTLYLCLFRRLHRLAVKATDACTLRGSRAALPSCAGSRSSTAIKAFRNKGTTAL